MNRINETDDKSLMAKTFSLWSGLITWIFPLTGMLSASYVLSSIRPKHSKIKRMVQVLAYITITLSLINAAQKKVT